jgi:hypothetical protein
MPALAAVKSLYKRVILSAAKDLGWRRTLLVPRSFGVPQDDGGRWNCR